ncbi:hypothetical protein LSAT2_001208 [Lamellibrachia satsuma]|nr:hypothetical protein LSAT2_001208 [Lamellibrachia satsuma]
MPSTHPVAGDADRPLYRPVVSPSSLQDDVRRCRSTSDHSLRVPRDDGACCSVHANQEKCRQSNGRPLPNPIAVIRLTRRFTARSIGPITEPRHELMLPHLISRTFFFCFI